MNCLLILNIFLQDQYNIYTPIEYKKLLNEITDFSHRFEFTILVNDSHQEEDKEFQYLPPHALKNKYQNLRNYEFEKSLKSLNFLFLTKNTLSALQSTHNRETILSYHFDQVCVGGMSGCIDVVPTCLDLIDLQQNVIVYPHLVGDFSPEYQTKAIEYLNIFNIVNLCH